MTVLRLLMLEDQADDALLLEKELRRAGFDADVRRVDSEPQYLAALADEPEVILADYNLPALDALRALRLLKERGWDIPFIVVTGAIGDELAAECMREGATDYLLKDRLSRLGPAVTRALAERRVRRERQRAEEELARLKERLAAENAYLQEEIKLEHNFEAIVGESAAHRNVLHQIEQVAVTNVNVLVLGETGTGKELVARAIHQSSPRRNRPLVKVNCAALPATLIESELFGHEKGAFTGASSRHEGRFELADGGTLFLDEIGDLPLELQAKLLRVLQDGELERVGNSRTIQVDVRVIAATNRNLAQAVSAGTFRQDLYYRLNVFPISVPPLRERREDIPRLVKAFVERFAKSLRKPIDVIPPEALERLCAYDWPGNVRELENVIERSVIRAADRVLHIDGTWDVGAAAVYRALEVDSLVDVERSHILRILEQTRWRIAGSGGAAERLGLKPSTLRSRMDKLGIERHKAQPVDRVMIRSS